MGDGDDAEDLAGCGLLLKRLAQLLVRSEPSEQPHVLDRDHGLVGEGFEESDLFVSKRTQLLYDES